MLKNYASTASLPNIFAAIEKTLSSHGAKQIIRDYDGQGRSVRFEEGRIANVIILCARDTVDEEWTRKALSQLTPERIRWIPVEELRTGKQTINFNEKYQYGNQPSNQGSVENPQD